MSECITYNCDLEGTCKAQNELKDKQQGTSVRFISIHKGPTVEKKTSI